MPPWQPPRPALAATGYRVDEPPEALECATPERIRGDDESESSAITWPMDAWCVEGLDIDQRRADTGGDDALWRLEGPPDEGCEDAPSAPAALPPELAVKQPRSFHM